jgi:iron complex outermembrane receptor protein
MKKVSHKLLLTTMALALGTAFAADKDAGDNIEKVVVTAQKREQTTLDVAQSVTVVSGVDLEKEQVQGFADYLKLVPGLQLVQGAQGAGRLVMRGINTGGVASTVAIYMDETPFGSSSGLVNGAVLAADFDTFDLSRIEVLRGPQGALYGASSLGGLMKFVTNLPDTKAFDMRARVGAAKVEGGGMGYKGNLMINVPISEAAAFRVSTSYNKTPGFIDSIGTGGSDIAKDINQSSNNSTRASLLVKANSSVSLRVSALAQNVSTNAPNSVESDPNTLTTLYGQQSQSQFVPVFRDVNYRLYNATMNADLGVATLTSSTSSATQNQHLRDDVTFNLSGLVKGAFKADNELYLGQKTNLKKFTQELRLTSNPGAAFDWQAGTYYTKEQGLIQQGYVPVVPGTLTTITTLPNLALVSLDSNYKETAAFGNVTLHAGDRTDIDIGARSSKNTQDAVQASTGALVGGTTNNVAASSESVSTFSLAPKYKIDERTSLYARVAKGYRPGGPNVLPPSAPAGTPKTYNSDTVLSTEAGYKMISADGKLGFDISAFHIKWNDIQLLAVVNGFGVNTNGVGATSDGVEFALSYRLAAGLRLSANGAFNNARLDGSTSPVVGGSAGDQLPFTPRVSYNLAADYRWAAGSEAKAFAGVSLRHVGKQNAGFDGAYRTANGHQRELAAYNVVDVHGGMELGVWTIDAYVKNLGNSDGKTSAGTQKANGANVWPNGAIVTGIIAPRMIGFTLTREY